jgi:hypothetical protein
MDLNVNQLVRSAVVLVVGLPLTVAVAVNAMPERKEFETTASEQLKEDLTLPCLKYAFTTADSKGERASKDAIDEAFGLDPNYTAICKWVLG